MKHALRGFDAKELAPQASASWAEEEEIVRLEFQPGDLLLGRLSVPSKEAWAQIEALQDQQQKIAANTKRQEAERRAQIDALQAQIEELAEADPMEIGFNDDRHMITVAGTRGGKTSTCLIPNLRRYPGSAVVIDPKGELARATAEARRAMGQKVIVLDPYNTTGLGASSAWNPLDQINPEAEESLETASSIAESLIIRSNSENAHFDESARALIKALILFTITQHPGRASCTLSQLHDYLQRGAWKEMARDKGAPTTPEDPHPFDYLLGLMERDLSFDGVIAAGVSALMSMGNRERGSVLSTARRNLEFLEKPAMRRVLARSSIKLDDLVTAENGATIYLCLPPCIQLC